MIDRNFFFLHFFNFENVLSRNSRKTLTELVRVAVSGYELIRLREIVNNFGGKTLIRIWHLFSLFF